MLSDDLIIAVIANEKMCDVCPTYNSPTVSGAAHIAFYNTRRCLGDIYP